MLARRVLVAHVANQFCAGAGARPSQPVRKNGEPLAGGLGQVTGAIDANLPMLR